VDRYTVEFPLPQGGWADVREAADRARAACDGEQVRFLRSVFVPEDDACFFLYEGPSAQSVTAAALRAKLGVPRVEAALRVDGEETP
jgi:hypothetical protein